MNDPIAVDPVKIRLLYAGLAAALLMIVLLRQGETHLVVPRLAMACWGLIGVFAAPRWPRWFALSVAVFLPAQSLLVLLSTEVLPASKPLFFLGTGIALVFLRTAIDHGYALVLQLLASAVVRAFVDSPEVPVAEWWPWWAAAFSMGSLCGLGWLAQQARARDVGREKREREQRAIDAANAKSQFLAEISHELRTPMAGIMGMAELLLDTSLSDEQRGFVEDLHNSSAGLLSLVNELLDLSKLEASRLSLSVEPLRLEPLVRSAVIPSFVSAERLLMALGYAGWGAGQLEGRPRPHPPSVDQPGAQRGEVHHRRRNRRDRSER